MFSNFYFVNDLLHNVRNVAAFFYGHYVSLGVASRVYTICNPYKAHHLIPYAMGGYYSNFYSLCDTCHMAQYYDVQHVLIMWVNGLNHLKLEPVHPSDQDTPPFDCKPLRHSPMASYADSTTNTLYNVQTFNIMDL